VAQAGGGGGGAPGGQPLALAQGSQLAARPGGGGGGLQITLAPAKPAEPEPPREKNYRQTVCAFWLKGMCMKGESCGFLHR
jgi:hypothetical protein